MSKYVVKSIVTILISALCTISGIFAMYLININGTTTELSNQLYYLGKQQQEQIDDFVTDIMHQGVLFTKTEAFIALDKSKISDVVAVMTEYNPEYQNIRVIDTEGELVYGYVPSGAVIDDDILDELTENKESVQRIVSGYEGYFIEVYTPIIGEDSEVVGVLSFKVSMHEIEEILDSSKRLQDTESYIVNKDGTFITKSQYIPDAIGKENVNINVIKNNIDYDSHEKYTNYTDEEVLGQYFELEIGDSTLVVEMKESVALKGTDMYKVLAQVVVSIQSLAIGAIQIIYKRRSGCGISEEELNDKIKQLSSNQVSLNEFNSFILEKLDNIIEDKSREKK